MSLNLIVKALEDALRLLRLILVEQKSMAQTMNELATDLNKVTLQLVKIGEETTKTLQLVEDLEEALASGGGTTPEVDAAMVALKAQVEKVDNLVPDAQPPGPGPSPTK